MRGRPFRHAVPRAALEPEQVPPPPKRSERARNPFVVVGNAIITILLVLMIGAGGAYYYGKQKLEAPGPLQEDKVVNIPARAGMTDIADILQREGVIDNNRWAFIGARVRAEGALGAEARRISVPEERQPARRHRHHRRRQGGAARRHDSRRPDLRADRGPADRQRYFRGLGPRNPARGHAAAGNLQIPARHHARPGDRAHAAGAEARRWRKSGNAAVPTFRSRRRSSW